MLRVEAESKRYLNIWLVKKDPGWVQIRNRGERYEMPKSTNVSCINDGCMLTGSPVVSSGGEWLVQRCLWILSH
jgi:hypothetical protein